MKEWALSRYRLFTTEQGKAIAHFLEFDAERDDFYEAQFEPQGRKNMAAKGYSPEEIDAAFEARKTAIRAKVALDRYWGQFL